LYFGNGHPGASARCGLSAPCHWLLDQGDPHGVIRGHTTLDHWTHEGS
jgi:hypothetical protein